ncbi:MAG: hypothetical protein ACI9KE_002318 [Polyangiales bacterium]|jgi:hypothetical protein
MSHDPISFLSETFPALFAKGVAQLEAKAAAGDAVAKSSLEDVKGAVGGVILQVEGEGAVYLRADNGQMVVLDSAPSDVKLAVAAPGAALRMLLGEAADAGELEESKAASRAVGTASKRLQDALGEDSLEFHLVATDVPDLGDITVKVGLNAAEPPAEPKFTATIAFPDLEAARNGEINVQQLFLGGKLKMTGDYSRALQLGMSLMAQMQQ